ncbi:MAG TPA: peroxiredoxin [Candidatus Limnocylindria bacterium]|jgi:peroxiredoxin Q/BCP|nr:peroxiredoxin [Candidatus Limnocylindria bacterium]
MLEPGATMPTLTVRDDTGAEISTQELLGTQLVLYFYPKDDTWGCTKEATQFRDAYDDFRRKGTELVGVSRDTVESHRLFKEKYLLPYRLLADVEARLCDAFGVIVDENVYGKNAIQRSTFLFAPSGTLVRVWPKVTVMGHADEVLKTL